VATSIFFTGIIASKTRFASPPPAAGASVSARGLICQERPQRSLHQPHWPSHSEGELRDDAAAHLFLAMHLAEFVLRQSAMRCASMTKA